MGKARTNTIRSGSTKTTKPKSQRSSAGALAHGVVLVDTVCLIAGSEHLLGANDKASEQLRSAIAHHGTSFLFGKLVEGFSFQGISDQAAKTFMDQHGRVQWHQVEQLLSGSVSCPKLKSYWSYDGCRYQKSGHICSEPKHIGKCPVPRLDVRRGGLNVMAYSFFLFIRDVADGDLVGWIDNQLRHANKGTENGRLSRMREALIGPLRNVFGVSDKVLSMALSDLLLAAPRTKRYWFETGTSMVAIDSLVHAFLHRTGILRQFDAQHAYGPACYRRKACADIITQIASRIDARQTCSKYPATFPRFVQHAIWRYCAQLELDVCNGNRIDDRRRCGNRGCPLFHLCDRVALHPMRP